MTNINQVANEIVNQVKTYSRQVTEEIETATNDVSKELVKNLKRDSPEKTGSYRKGWRIKKFKGRNKVYNKTDYQLTHLLEKGHAKKNGGRIQPQVHIAPNEETAIKDLTNRVKRAVEQ